MTQARFLAHRRTDIHAEAVWSQYRQVNRALSRALERVVPAPDPARVEVVVDFGCANRPYEQLVSAGRKYIGADLPGNASADVYMQEGRVPVEDGSVDLVLSTQVLEHVEEPQRYLRECHRMLRLGGALVLTTHGIMYYHRDPEDYWRWTADGLELELRRAGLDVEEVVGVLGFAATALQLFQDATVLKLPRLLRKPYVGLMQALVGILDRQYEDPARRANAMVIAVRARKVPIHGAHVP